MSIAVAAPTFEHHRDALGIGEPSPRISWKTRAPAGWTQASYELEVTRAGDTVTSIVDDSDSVLRSWPAAPLESRERAVVRVRVTGHDGTTSNWSEPAAVETGLLHPEDWTAMAVGANWPQNPHRDDRRPPVLRRDFDAREGLESARLYVTAHGVYEVEINGRRIGDDAMSPGWTPYREKLRYYTYDVTTEIAAGANAIGAWLGDGWYRGRMGWRGGFRNVFGTDLSLLAQLELRYSDGTIETIATDGDWRATPSPILQAGNYDGETYDARVAAELSGWSRPGFDASLWTRVVAAHRDPATLTAPEGPPVRCTQEVAPVELLTTPTGRRVLDFGQNLVGRPRFRVSGRPGDVVRFRTAEVLQEGEIYTRPLRDAKSTDEYILAGDGSRSGSRGSHSTASGMPRSIGQEMPSTSTPRSPPEISSPGSITPTWSAPGGSNPRIRWWIGFTRTSCGACAATSSTSRPIARSGMSASAGPEICRCSRRPPRSCTTCPGCCRAG